MTAKRTTERLERGAWLAIPMTILLITTLWVVDPQEIHESKTLMIAGHLVFTWLGSLCICILTARGFLSRGQPGLLLFSCGSLLWGASSLVASLVLERVNTSMTIHNLGIFCAALCHFAGMWWKGRLRRPAYCLVAAYVLAAAVVGIIVNAALAGVTPRFFVQGVGGTEVRHVVLLSAISMFAWVGWQMIYKFRHEAGWFYYWYGLGLSLVATALAGALLVRVQGTYFVWACRATQCLASVYLFIAAWKAARSSGSFSLSAMDGVVKDYGGGLDWRTAPIPRWVSRYGLAVVSTVVAMVIRWLLVGNPGPEMPPYTLFYPAIMLATMVGGIGPGVVATILSDFFAVFFILSPANDLSVPNPPDRLGLALFTAVCLLMCLIAEAYRRIRERVVAYERESVLYESRERLATFAAATFEGIIESRAGKIVDCNEVCSRMLGYPVSELRGRAISDFIPPEERDNAMMRLWSEEHSVVELTLLDLDLRPIMVEVHARSIIPGCEVRHLAIRDISARKNAEKELLEWNFTLERRVSERTYELEQSHARFHQLADASFEGIVVTEAGVVLDGNAQYGKMHGHELADVIGCPVSDFIAPESLARVLERIGNDEMGPCEIVAMRKDGSTFPAEVNTRQTTWMGRPARISAIQDLSRIREFSARFQAQQIELERAHRLGLLSEVSAGIIHQIAQPLSAVGANVAAARVRLENGRADTCGVLEIVHDLEESVRNMREVVTHMRSLIRHDPQKIFERLDFNPWMADALRPLRMEAENSRIKLVAEFDSEPMFVMADPVQLNQMLLILARNAFDACKDCPAERRRVLISTRRRAERGVELCVTDSGVGIPPDIMPDLFLPFFTTKSNGMGIGLSLCRTISAVHGGEIHASNNEDDFGATFRLSLPAVAERELHS